MKMRTIKEVMVNGKSLEDILIAHANWLNGKGGERADLSYANLRFVNLSGVDLRYADLEGAKLEGAKLKDANLECSDLEGSDLKFVNLGGTDFSFSNLRSADLEGADLEGADFYLTNLYKAKGDFVGVENIGSRNDTTHYFYKINRVNCGCFDGTIEEFEEKVKNTYKSDDKEYKQYMIAIRTLKELAELEKEE